VRAHRKTITMQTKLCGKLKIKYYLINYELKILKQAAIKWSNLRLISWLNSGFLTTSELN